MKFHKKGYDVLILEYFQFSKNFRVGRWTSQGITGSAMASMPALGAATAARRSLQTAAPYSKMGCTRDAQKSVKAESPYLLVYKQIYIQITRGLTVAGNMIPPPLPSKILMFKKHV